MKPETSLPRKRQRGVQLKLAPYEQKIRQLVADHPDATLVELHALLPNKDNVTVVTLLHFLKRLKMTWKQRLLLRQNRSVKT